MLASNWRTARIVAHYSAGDIYRSGRSRPLLVPRAAPAPAEAPTQGGGRARRLSGRGRDRRRNGHAALADPDAGEGALRPTTEPGRAPHPPHTPRTPAQRSTYPHPRPVAPRPFARLPSVAIEADPTIEPCLVCYLRLVPCTTRPSSRFGHSSRHRFPACRAGPMVAIGARPVANPLRSFPAVGTVPALSEAARSRRSYRFPAAPGFGRSASRHESGTGNPLT